MRFENALYNTLDTSEGVCSVGSQSQNMMRKDQTILHVSLLVTLLIATVVNADDRSRLYTKPDPSSHGGIKGHINSPSMPIEQILALPPDEVSFAYEGKVTGDDRRGFLFENLPMRKYSLVVIYDKRFIEGIQLHREESTLTKQDIEELESTIQKSEPFFNHKTIHRLEGETGRGNFAQAIVTYFSGKKTITYITAPSAPEGREYRRTFKLVLLKDVGPGWQIVKARDLYPKSVAAGEGEPDHEYSKTLSGIRVTDTTKDLGELTLSRSNK